MTEPTPTAATTPAPTATTATTPAPTPPATVEFTPEQQREVDSRIAAARRAAENEGKSKAEQAAAAERAKADEEAKRKKQEEQGEYETAKAGLVADRDEWKAKAEGHEGRLNAALEAIKPGVDKRWADLPQEVATLYAGDEADVLAKAAFLDRTADLAARLTTQTGQRVGVTPRPTGDGPADKQSDTLRKANERRYQ